MAERQFTTPMLIENDEAVQLVRVPFDERKVRESWLQELLYTHPALLPVGEIEPVFDGLLPLARELPTNAGAIDLVFINAEGMITIAETKLWRSPEARRQVVAQVIDYAKELARWSYSDLAGAVKGVVRSAEPDPVMALVASSAKRMGARRTPKAGPEGRLARFGTLPEVSGR